MSYIQAQEELIGRIRLAPNRTWISNYLDLVRQLIIGLDIRHDNPRLAITIPQKANERPFLPVSINYRYVIEPDFNNGELIVGFILGENFIDLPNEVKGQIKKICDFDRHPNIREVDPPGWFNAKLDFFMKSNALRVAWI